jgi:hypothetical protein
MSRVKSKGEFVIMPKAITYADLFQLLCDLDFVDKSVKDSHVVFRQEESDTVILFGLHDPAETVAPHDVAKVRRVLDERGLLNSEDFNAFVVSGRMSRSQAGRSTAS